MTCSDVLFYSVKRKNSIKEMKEKGRVPMCRRVPAAECTSARDSFSMLSTVSNVVADVVLGELLGYDMKRINNSYVKEKTMSINNVYTCLKSLMSSSMEEEKHGSPKERVRQPVPQAPASS